MFGPNFKFFSLLLIMGQIFHVFQAKLLSELNTLLCIRFNIKLFRELKACMDLHVDKHVVVEYNSSEVNEHYIRDLT